MKEFSQLELRPELVDALKKIGFVNATEVQEQAIPVALKGKDLIVRAKTGTGKTGAFLIPIMQSMHLHESGIGAIIITPTRELALQVSSVAGKLGSFIHLRTTTVYGGASINVQMEQLRRGTNIVVGTPGRIIDLVERGALRLERIKYLVLDEADTMLDMGFIDDIELIISRLPHERQTMMFSATMPKAIVDIARHHMKDDYQTITVGKEEEITVNTISHSYYVAKGRMKFAALLSYIDQFQPKKAIIFSRTQHEADLIHDVLRKNGHDAILIHGGLTQARREHSLHSFRSGARFMVATNVAARGLDIADVTDIINFDAPDTPFDYVHRVGRSARMGKEGRAFTLIGLDQKGLMRAIQMDANVEMKEIQLNTGKYNNLEIPHSVRRFEGRTGGGFHHGNREGGGGFRQHGGRDRGPHRGGGGGRPYQRRGYSSDRRNF
ncbi:MAG: DEAD/DEAH box helicase [Candidatus Micrarchaeales archaeon]|nr:DEAD/DEAH box helicase [Candidatus Micrarchaeales archaeon]